MRWAVTADMDGMVGWVDGWHGWDEVEGSCLPKVLYGNSFRR